MYYEECDEDTEDCDEIERDCLYTCSVLGYEPEQILDFDVSHTDCYSSSDGMAGTTMCPGVPYHDDYLA